MVEVLKTNVRDRIQANMVLSEIHTAFDGYKANFDLQDCDRILRVECKSGKVQVALLIELLKEAGVEAEALPDEDFILGSRSILPIN